MDRVFRRGDTLTIEDLQEGGVLLIDKPLEWTSFDVVNKLRYAIRKKLGLKKYKIGHAGTLDPLATGLLVICFKKYTKKINEMIDWDKSYTGTIRLWGTTPSYDAELPIDTYYPQQCYDDKELEQIRQRFLGDQMQFPPKYSAIKKNGVPLYKLARKGKDVEVKARPVHISQFDLTRVDFPHIDFESSVSKGTYIRSLAHDYGQALGNGAYLSALRRTRVGTFTVEGAWDVLELTDVINAIPAPSE